MNPESQLGPDCPVSGRSTDYARWMIWIQVVILVHASTIFWTETLWQWLTPFKVSQVYVEFIAAFVMPCFVALAAWKQGSRPRRVLPVLLSAAIFVLTLCFVLFFILCLSIAYL